MFKAKKMMVNVPANGRCSNRFFPASTSQDPVNSPAIIYLSLSIK